MLIKSSKRHDGYEYLEGAINVDYVDGKLVGPMPAMPMETYENDLGHMYGVGVADGLLNGILYGAVAGIFTSLCIAGFYAVQKKIKRNKVKQPQ